MQRSIDTVQISDNIGHCHICGTLNTKQDIRNSSSAENIFDDDENDIRKFIRAQGRVYFTLTKHTQREDG